jgi:hypothetical protein
MDSCQGIVGTTPVKAGRILTLPRVKWDLPRLEFRVYAASVRPSVNRLKAELQAGAVSRCAPITIVKEIYLHACCELP